jgi:hypothetical protein
LQMVQPLKYNQNGTGPATTGRQMT